MLHLTRQLVTVLTRVLIHLFSSPSLPPSLPPGHPRRRLHRPRAGPRDDHRGALPQGSCLRRAAAGAARGGREEEPADEATAHVLHGHG